jgi:iron complex transport system permease protein
MKRAWPYALFFAALFILAGISLFAGTVYIDPADLRAPSEEGALARLILWELRAPRTLLAIASGAALGLSGAALQGLTRNPLAEPGLLGVTTGASLGAVIAIYFGVSSFGEAAIPVFGLLGAGIAGCLTFALGRGGGTFALILGGAAVAAFMAALIALALNLAKDPYAAYEIMTWLMGSLADKSWNHVLVALPFVMAGCALLAATGRGLDALSLGEAQAESLGVDLFRLRLLVLAGTAAAVGASTSVTGAIGFIGLVAPHLVRPFVGFAPGRVLIPAAFAGAILVLAADILTRLIVFGPGLRLGVITSLLGTPFFFHLIIRLRKVSP